MERRSNEKTIIKNDTYIFLDSEQIFFRNNEAYFDIKTARASRIFEYLSKREIYLQDLMINKDELLKKEILFVIKLLVERNFAFYKKTRENETCQQKIALKTGKSVNSKSEIILQSGRKIAFVKKINQNFPFDKYLATYYILQTRSSQILIEIRSYEEYLLINKDSSEKTNKEPNNLDFMVRELIDWMYINRHKFINQCLQISDNLQEIHVRKKFSIETAESLMDYFENKEKIFSEHILNRDNISQLGLSKWALRIKEKRLVIHGISHLVAQTNAFTTFWEETYSVCLGDNEEVVCLITEKGKKNNYKVAKKKGILKNLYKNIPAKITFQEVSFSKCSKCKYYEEILKNQQIDIGYKMAKLTEQIYLCRIEANQNYSIGIGESYESATICAYEKLFFSRLNKNLNDTYLYSWMLHYDELNHIENNIEYLYCTDLITKNKFFELIKIRRKNVS